MGTDSPRFDGSIRVAPGDGGRLLARAGACLFVPTAVDAGAAAFVEHAWHSTGDLSAAVMDFVRERDGAPSFVLVTWPTTAGDPSIRLVVRGDVAIETDMASLSCSSDAEAGAWVEHRVQDQPKTAELRAGASSALDTELRHGLVPAGGFQLRLTEVASEPSAPISVTDDATASPGAPTGPRNASPSGIAALRAASRIVPPQGAEVRAEPARTPGPATGSTSVDESSTATSTGEHPVRDAAQPEPATTPVPDSRSDIEPTPTEPAQPEPDPARAGTAALPVPITDTDDPEATIGGGPAAAGAVAVPAAKNRSVRAVICPNGHPNPPQAATCRHCQTPLRSGRTAFIERPVLAMAELPSGAIIPIDSDLVFGRNPSAEDAKVDADHRLVRLDVPNSVSRTHLVICADGWSITGIDCDSRAGTALTRASTDEEPIALTAWEPQRLNAGDTLYLGGLTTVRILDAPS